MVKEGKSVTIDIGVICDNRKTAIACSDRMLTSGDNTLAFEHDVPKIVELFGNCLALTAGAATIHQPIIQAVQTEIRETKPNIADVVIKMKDYYQNCRRSYMSDIIFSRRGLTLEDFYRNQRTLHESTILELNNEMDEFDLGLDVIVIGVDRGSEAHIYQISNPGVAIPQDALGFVCTGTGQRHADVVFAYRKYAPSFPLKRAIYIAFEAKKKAEMAGGVGPTTDIAIIKSNGLYKMLPQTVITELEKIYLEMEKKSQIDAMIDNAVEKLPI